jgi:hypothetical protein
VYCLFVLLFITAVPSVPHTVYCLFVLLFITAVPSVPLSHILLSVRFGVFHCCPFCPSLSQSHNKPQLTHPINHTTHSYTKHNISVHFGHSLLYILYHFIDILRSYWTIN